jgi:hypothetical protein
VRFGAVAVETNGLLGLGDRLVEAARFLEEPRDLGPHLARGRIELLRLPVLLERVGELARQPGLLAEAWW